MNAPLSIRHVYAHLDSGNSLGPLGLSILLHLILLGASWLLLAFTPVQSTRKLQLTSARTAGATLQVSFKTSRPNHTRKGAPAQKIGGATNKATSRFASDVLRSHTRLLLANIIYPRKARRLGWQGRVRVRALVAPDGRVLQASIAGSSGYGILDEAALKGVRKHRFDPGESTESIVLSLRFQLSRDSHE